MGVLCSKKRRLTFIVSLVITTTTLGYEVTSADSGSPNPIRVVSTDHEIHSPFEIIFNLEAEAIPPITKVTLFYRLSERNVKIYEYPEFQTDTHVSADFTLKTNASNYLPSGVDVEYYDINRNHGHNYVTIVGH